MRQAILALIGSLLAATVLTASLLEAESPAADPSVQQAGGGVLSPPVVGPPVIVSADPPGTTYPSQKRVFADPQTGQTVWRLTSDGAAKGIAHRLSGIGAGRGVFSPDSTAIVYAAFGQPTLRPDGVYLMELASGAETFLAPAPPYAAPVFANDGSGEVYYFANTGQIRAVNTATFASRLILAVADAQAVSVIGVNADGRRLLATIKRGGDWHVVVVTPAGELHPQWTIGVSVSADDQASWSPTDPALICAVRTGAWEDQHIQRIDTLEVLSPCVTSYGSWHPNGRWFFSPTRLTEIATGAEVTPGANEPGVPIDINPAEASLDVNAHVVHEGSPAARAYTGPRLYVPSLQDMIAAARGGDGLVPSAFAASHYHAAEADGLPLSARWSPDGQRIVWQSNISDLRDGAPPGGTHGVDLFVLPVTLNTPVLHVEPTQLAFSTMQGAGAVDTQSLLVTNTGGGSFSTVTATDDAAWLTVERLALPGGGGGDARTYVARIDQRNLMPGAYTATITVTAAGALGSPLKIPVTLTIAAAAPLLRVAPVSLAFSAVIASPEPPAQQITVSNSGGGAMPFQVGDDADWLMALPGSGLNHATLVVNINHLNLQPGTYQGVITVTAPAAANSPAAIPVTLTVRSPAPVLQVHPASLQFSAIQGAGAAASQPLTVSNTAHEPMAWSIADDALWLSVSPASGAADAQVAVSVSGFNLPVGTFSATITVTAPAAVGSPLAIPVNFRVEAATDLTPPTIFLVAPERETIIYGGSPATLTVEARDQVGVAGVQFYVDGAPVGPEVMRGEQHRFSIMWQTAGAVEGSHVVTAVARDAANNRQATVLGVPVTVRHQPVATLSISPASLSFTMELGLPEPATQALQVAVVGAEPSRWHLSDHLGDWMSLSPMDGIRQTAVAVDVIRASGRAPGTYAGSVTFTLAGPIIPQVAYEVPMTLTVAPPTPQPGPPSKDTAPPTIPRLVRAIALEAGMKVSWEASRDDGAVAGYRVKKNHAPLTTTQATEYLDPEVITDAVYRYQVAAIDAAGNQSDFSLPEEARYHLDLSGSGDFDLRQFDQAEQRDRSVQQRGEDEPVITTTSDQSAPPSDRPQPQRAPQPTTTQQPHLLGGSTVSSIRATGQPVSVAMAFSASAGRPAGQGDTAASALRPQAAGAAASASEHEPALAAPAAVPGAPSARVKQPVLSVSPTRLVFVADPATPAAPRQISISLIGRGKGTWNLRSDAAWLRLHPSSGGVSGSVEVRAESAGVSPGVYEGALTVEAPGARGSPQTIAVTLIIAAAAAEPLPSSLDVTLHDPAEGATVSGQIPIVVTLQQAIGSSATAVLAIDEQDLMTTTISADGGTIVWDASEMAPGPHRLTVTVTDEAGRSAAITRPITIEAPATVPPRTPQRRASLS
ncbi:MAG: PD40 domain-containing protein [Candidatus Omnitrophica bacterium]|nr:PD40 domain-containing protein [Candidatus Omnitrophota bacterium]